MQELTKNDFKTIVEMQDKSQRDNIGNLIDKIKKFVDIDCRNKYRRAKITSNQLRNIYDEIKQCNDNIGLQLVRPKLAYIAGRQEETRDIVAFFDELLKEANEQIIKTNKEDGEKNILKNIKTFFEAVLSFHKFYYKES